MREVEVVATAHPSKPLRAVVPVFGGGLSAGLHLLGMERHSGNVIQVRGVSMGV